MRLSNSFTKTQSSQTITIYHKYKFLSIKQLTSASCAIYIRPKGKWPAKAKSPLVSNQLEFRSNRCLYVGKSVCPQV